MNRPKRIIFLSGTRADYGKLKPLAVRLSNSSQFEVHLFVTGMHLLHKYGLTARAVLREFKNVYLYNNQPSPTSMDLVLSNTIYGFSSFVSELNPDMIIVHGDRPEALAGAIVGSFNNILVAHIEGGEVSGTIDELIRHSVSKLSHLHFVSNKMAQQRLVQLGESKDRIFAIGSPDIDIMLSDTLPSFKEVCEHYDIRFSRYAIAIYHPVTTALEKQAQAANMFFDSLLGSKLNYIVVRPNNDLGCEIIDGCLDQIEDNPQFRIFPSIEFGSFLTLLKSCQFIIGNSSAGIREAPVYAKWTINVGSRQFQRSSGCTIMNVDDDKNSIDHALCTAMETTPPDSELALEFGDGNSVERFMTIIADQSVWSTPSQKQFVSLF